jgi:hypothetical protein
MSYHKAIVDAFPEIQFDDTWIKGLVLFVHHILHPIEYHLFKILIHEDFGMTE